MSKTVLVTGGTGFVGGWTIVELLRRGYAVRTTVRSLAKEAGLRRNLGAQIEAGDRLTVLAADLSDDPGWGPAVAGCDDVLHIASPMGRHDGDDASMIAAARDGAL